MVKAERGKAKPRTVRRIVAEAEGIAPRVRIEKWRCGAGARRNTRAMKNWMGGLVLGGVILTTAGAAAEEIFSQAVRPGDFAAAGLAKLSPEELMRLDALVRDFKSGALARAQREAAAAEARAAQAEQRTAAATAAPAPAEPAKKGEVGSSARTKVQLTPGTEVEYATVESRIAGEFRGWELRTVFTLENGQRWQVTGGESYVTSPVPGPAVKIAPGIMGAFWMTIDGVRSRVKVVPLGGAK